MLGAKVGGGIKRNRIADVTAQIMSQARLRNVFLAEVTADVARQMVPVKTGALRASIRVEERGASAATVAGGETAPYAPEVELGTVDSAARPYLRPAAESAVRGTGKRFRFNVR